MTKKIEEAIIAERERCAMVCENIGVIEAIGDELGNAAMVRVAERMAAICAEEIRKGTESTI